MNGAAAIRGRLRRQHGQILPLVAVMIVALIGMAAIVFDFGRLYVAREQLQNAVDAAALVAGQDLPNATSSYGAATSYSGATGDKNAVGGYEVTTSTPDVTFECLATAPNYTSGATPTCPTDTSTPTTNCHPSGAQAPQPAGATTCNAVKVTETTTVQTTLAGVLPFIPASYTFTASSTSAARGGEVHPIHAYVILDNTGSMTDACNGAVTGISSPEKIDCAKAGMRALLQSLWPCDSKLPSCGTATANSAAADGTPQLGANVTYPVDQVGLLVFPAIKVLNPASSTPVGDEVDCNPFETFADTYPRWTPYTYTPGAIDGGIPATDPYLGYQAVALSSDYRPSALNTTLNWTTSNLVEAVDWGQCPGSTYPSGGFFGFGRRDYYGLKIKQPADQGSYLAGAITEAQHLLNMNAQPGVSNVIIIESDGQLNDPSGFIDNNPCNSAISAATQAKAAGTQIYSIAYGSNGTRCADTSYHYTDLQAMTAIASNSESLFNQPSAGDLTAAFQQVATDLTDSRLLPDGS